MKSLNNYRWMFLAVVSGLVFVVDQVSKWAVVQNLEMFESVQPIPAISPVFEIIRSYNTGAAFGLFSGAAAAGNFFLVIAIVVSAVLIYSYPRIEDGQWMARLATGLVIGGALGNAVDRITYGHVVDFIHYQIPGVVSNVSNVADHAIVLGVGLMILSSWRNEPRRQAQPENSPKNEAN